MKNPSVRSGVALFAAGGLYCGFAKFKGITECSWKVQAGAFAVAALAKTVVSSSCFKEREDKGAVFLENVATFVLIGAASKLCQFKFSLLGGPSNTKEGTFFSTIAIAAGYFGFNKLLEPAEEPKGPPPPRFAGLDEVTLSPREFRRLLLSNELPPIPITVDGDLELPKELGWGERIKDIPECPELQALPERLTINGNLRLIKCTSITELPSDIHVTGGISFSRCNGLIELPDNLQVNQFLRLTECLSITKLPKNLNIRILILEKCRNIKELPEDLVVSDILQIYQSEITRIPDNLRELERLELKGCIELTELPENLNVTDWLHIQNCLSLEHLPNGLRAGGGLRVSININGWSHLERHFLPEEWRDLYLGKVDESGRRLDPTRAVKAIHELPENLFVGGDLDFSESRVLRSLPKGLHVGGELNLPASRIEELPEDLVVGGDISLRGSCLKKLPSWITTIGTKADGEERDIDLVGTRISEEDIRFLKSQEFPGIKFYLDDHPRPAPGFFDYPLDPYQDLKIQGHLLTLQIVSGNRPTKEQVKKAYRDLARIHHPDKNEGKDNGETFKRIHEAYEALMESGIDD